MLVNVDVVSYVESNDGYSLEIQVLDQEGKPFIAARKLGSSVTFKDTKDAGSNYFKAASGGRVSAEAPIKWSAENPYLYTAVITLKNADGEAVDVKSVRFGYCKAGYAVDDEGNQSFTMNGEKVKLYGVVYNEFNAATGSYVPYEQKVEDVKALKAMNVNAVRSPGVPFSSEFIALCDEYGIYVVSDINLESEPYSAKGDATIPGNQTIWQNILVDRLYNVVERDKNAPSVIMWGLGNESGQGSSFKSLRSVLQGLDKRLIVYDGDTQYSDLVVANDWDFSKLNEVLNDTENKKPVLLESFDIGLLNGGGNISSLVSLIDSSDKVQGGFFSYFIDKALYWPKDSANAATILKEKPYATNSAEYQLTYSGSWGESLSDSYKGLTGLLTANRTWQPEAYEFKNVFSPIAVSAVDVKNGKFSVTNRLNFTAFEDAYEVIWEVYKEAELVKSGKVEGLSILPGESAEFTVDYGTLAANVDYFVDIRVVTLNETKWNDLTDGVVASWQYDITGYEALPLTGGEETDFGDALEVEIIEKPEVVTTVLDIAKGYIYVSNNFSENLGDIFDCTFELIETNNFWKKPRPVVISSGTVDLDIPAYSQDVKVQLVYDNEQKAVEGGDYLVKVKFVAKKALGDIPAGYTFVWNFDDSTLGAPIPFEVDKSRTPVQDKNEDGSPKIDGKGNPIMIGGDVEPETVPEVDVNDSALSEQEDYEPYILIKNDRVEIIIDSKMGTILKFAIDGENVFANSAANSSPEFVLYRNPTGGDLLSDVTSKENSDIISLSRNGDTYHKLIDAVKVNQISENHYQVALNYALVTYDYELFSSVSANANLAVTYDIFGNGEIVISYAYDPTVLTGIPSEIANIVVFDKGYDTFSWYGRGLGESYSDRLADTRVSIYENVDVSELISTRYVYNAGTGDRSDVRWVKLAGEEKTPVLISSTSGNFAFNASYTNGLSASDYARNVSAGDIFLRIIAEQRGVSAGNVVDANNYDADNIIEPGSCVEFSYRIKPLANNEDEMAAAKTYIKVDAPSVDRASIESGKDYSITSIASGTEYLTVANGSVSLEAGKGSDGQLWKLTEDSSTGFDAIRLENVAYDGIISPPYAVYDESRTAIDVGLGQYAKARHWANWQHIDDQLKPLSVGWALIPMNEEIGSHVVLQDPKHLEGNKLAQWDLIEVDADENLYVIQNKKTGDLLTVIDELTYRNAIVEILADRKLNYAGTIDWISFAAMDATAYVDNGSGGTNNWAKLEKSLTIWNALPSDSQKWTFTQVSVGEFTITNKDTGLALTYDGEVLSEQTANGNANQIWAVIDDNGVYGLVNKANGGALTLDTLRVPLTEEELAAIYVTVEDDKYKEITVLTVQPWAGLATQKWYIESDADREIVIEAGDSWYLDPVVE